MRRIYFLFLSTLFIFQHLSFAQTPVSSTFQSNNVRAVVNANGNLFTDFQQGQFVPVQPGLVEKTLLRGSGLWIAGFDPAGNLHGAVQSGTQSDFRTGVLADSNNAVIDLNNVWRVNCADINAHLADLQDNGQVDHPNAAVYAWPATGNQFNNVGAYSVQGLAGFYDKNDDQTYNPEDGDYPSVEIRGCPLSRYPDEMGFFFSNDNTGHPSGLQPVQLEVQTQIYAYQIQPANSVLNNTIFVRYKLINRSPDVLDSCFVGLYADFSIGGTDDDFVGSDPGRSLIYAYNGDNNDEGGFGNNAPVMAIDLMRGPLDTFGNRLPLSHFIAVENVDTLQGLELYNLLSGSFPDGTPAPNNGLIYPGNPNNPAEPSEGSAGNTPGHRVGVASYGPFTLRPGAVNELIVAYYYLYQPGNTTLQNVQLLYEPAADAPQQLLDNCFAQLPGQVCEATVEAPEPAIAANELRLYPSPAATNFTIESKGGAFSRIEITDFTGRLIQRLELDKPTFKQQIVTAAWPAGLYAVRVGGQLRKVVVAR